MAAKGIQVGALALALLATGTASAQERKPGKRGDVNVFLKGGLGDYTGNLGDLTNTGPAWGLTLNVQPTTFIGFELGYEGSQNGIDDIRLLDDGPSIVRQGGSALVKVSPPFLTAVRPFVGAGFGLSYVDVRGIGGGLYDSDTMEEVPLAAGVEFNSGALTAGVRATWRVLLDNGFANDALDEDTDGGLLDASVTLGARF
ncbi:MULTISPECIES: outer membrane beta-barrel protein [Myxococcus]|uniref:Outer membrane protein beta-barrel domain-containing protein n=1 Tax=Myxococcus llanfairpwllgwyngyllgogerychwyrndrobwllllantysiliogogogochensis TaxID=2590453 RepID=A0A540X1D2_9BACT|nr:MULTISPECIES: hypothetical protein [Myxococcus]NTX01541.1 hypothetical protein [Myxococcus sp. CA040A]TQF15059.1 hypothetical protein FJV41_15405 [Myxococcus llanfairpwllgwyngyllgogerychwyrndrobwllllantysiliogogogochensis]